MNPAAGRALAARLDGLRERSCPSDHHVEVVRDAGHFVFLEQPQQFNEALLRATEAQSARNTAQPLAAAGLAPASTTAWRTAAKMRSQQTASCK
jgi:hypothetical protein